MGNNIIILHKLYEQLIFLSVCYGESINIDTELITNEYTVSLIEMFLYDGEITEATLHEYNNLKKYHGLLSDDNNKQANIDNLMNEIIELQKTTI